MRILAGIAAVFAVGLTAGWWLSRAEASAGPRSTATSTASESADFIKLRAQLRQSEDQRGMLAERNAALEKETDNLKKEQSNLEEALREAAALSTETPAPAAGSETPEANPDPAQRGNRRRAAATPEQIAQTWRDFQDQMQKRMDDALAKMHDPKAAQQKLVSDVKAALDNPFFRMEPMLVGGGPGGPGGPAGFGGFGGGNGGRGARGGVGGGDGFQRADGTGGAQGTAQPR